LSRATAIEGLFITDLCEDKIAVNPHVAAEIEHLRNERVLKLSVTPIYKTNQVSFKLCYLNARSLHKHIDDIRHDLILLIQTSIFFLKLDVYARIMPVCMTLVVTHCSEMMVTL
jgi:hypothetical protein